MLFAIVVATELASGFCPHQATRYPSSPDLCATLQSKDGSPDTNKEEEEQEQSAHEIIDEEHIENVSEIAPTWKPHFRGNRRMKLMWCTEEFCKDVVREKVVGRKQNQIVLSGPATGQVVYYWDEHTSAKQARGPPYQLPQDVKEATELQEEYEAPTVFLLIKSGDEELMKVAADAVKELCEANVNILLDEGSAARIKYNHGVDSDRIHLYEAKPTPGFGDNIRHDHMDLAIEDEAEYSPDLVCTLGGDGLLMAAGMMFQGPVPPILSIAGGSLGFLTPFSIDEMVEAVLAALGQQQEQEASAEGASVQIDQDIDVFPPSMSQYPYASPLKERHQRILQQNAYGDHRKLPIGLGNQICLYIRMRLECSILSQDGSLKSRYNVLNEVVVDRGISPYLAALECFCDDVHLTTVQADGVIFATPTGSTAYALAAGSSVVHPAVPCILLTPICPHVLSFRPMVFPDHVVLRCYVPDDARAEASVAFDGKHRQELRRGDALEIKMSPYPVPTINRVDQSSDWLGNLKRNFNFNSRARQRPL